MVHIGNTPASNFASVTKDTFSGDGSTTAFTLSKAATTNGVAVFVENVRQEPTTAYAVSGTTLTFTAAPVSASGNNIYVLHHNTPASTATHPSAQALTATSGTFTGAFTSVGIDDNADATTMTIDSSENVGIGNTSPSSQYMTRLVVGDGSGTEGITIYSGNDATGRLEFSDATSGDGRYAGGIVYEHTNNALRFNTNGGNERLRIDSGGDIKVYAGDIYFNTSGKGIVLGATSNTDANTLDDYEEGTWDVAVACGTSGSITIRSDYNEGYYNKVGTLVHAQGYIVVSGVSSPSGYISIGLPFAVANTSSEGGDWSTASVTIQGSAKNVNQMNATLIAGGSQSILVYASDAVTLQADSAEAIAADDSIYFSCTYRSA